ncbi:MAG: ABC-F family ATP-binding cassette domain-containing protein [Acidobacteriota bacterium]
MIFRLHKVCKEFGTQVLFRGVSCQCNAQDRIGLIGRNGCGKTTLFDLIEGRLDPDEGQLQRASSLTTARIPQRPDFQPGNTVLQEALRVFKHLAAVEERLGELESEMAASRSHELPAKLAEEYESLQMQMRLKGGYGYRARTEAVLLGIGFSAKSLQSPWEHLSGGQQNRLLVAQTLLNPADLLLLDEPTNHLDLEAIFWLTGYLSSLNSAHLVISHDRRFLDQVTEQTWEIEGRRLHRYSGSFSAARRERQQRLEQQRKAYEQQQEWKARTEDFVRRNLVGQKTKQAQARRRQLEKAEWLEAPLQDNAGLRLRIQEGRRGGALSFQIQKGEVGYPGTVLLEDLTFSMRRGERIGIVGGNGSGKSTLLNTIAGDLPLLSGSLEWGPNNDLAYFSQNPWLGDGAQTVYDSLREKDPFSTDEALRSFAALFLFRGDDVFKPVQALSGGERSRLALARLVHEPANILIMDEPTNHLDIVSSEALEEMLKNYRGTLLVVSHDLYFLDKVVDQFFLIRKRRLKRLESFSQISFGEEGPRSKKAPSTPKPALSRQKPRASKNELRRMREKVEKLEARVEELEARKADLEECLKLAGHPYEELHRLSEQHQQIEKELSGLYGKWEEQAHRLSEMEG